MSLTGKLFQNNFNRKYYRIICEAYDLQTKENRIIYREEFYYSSIYNLSEKKFKSIIKINNIKIYKFTEIRE